MNVKPEILEMVEKQTHKSYRERNGRAEMREGRARKDPLSDIPEFANTAKCIACGKEKFVNTCGFCSKCWITFAHLRKQGAKG